MSKTLLAVNTLTSVGSQAYASHLNLAFRMAKSEDEFLLFNGWRMSIDRFRNEAGKIALQQECDYLMFLDDDVLVPKDTYSRLKARDLDIITPVVYIRGYPFKPMFFKEFPVGDSLALDHYSEWKEAETQDGLLKVAAVGFSCCLIKCDLLRRTPPAWFVTGTNHTEDVYFCMKVRQCMTPTIGVDTTLQAGHMLDPEFVADQTVEHLRAFYEAMDPDLKKRVHGDHASDYLSKNLENLNKLEKFD